MLLCLCATDAPAQLRLGEGTSDDARRLITMRGTITSNANVIQVNASPVALGRRNVVKNESNMTGESWRGWEITFGSESRVVPGSPCSSTLFRQCTIVSSRNAVVFHDGEVPPGAVLRKTSMVEQIAVGPLRASHNRSGNDPTQAQIDNGVPPLPVVVFDMTLSPVPGIPAVGGAGLMALAVVLLAAGGLLLRRRRGGNIPA